jgi:hypothetical protein
VGRETVASVVSAVLLAVAGVGCGLMNRGGPVFGADDADSVLSYLLVDYSIGGDSEANGPKVFFKAANAGSQEHELEVLDDQDKPLGEIEAFAPGAFADPLALELKVGTYTLQCTLKTTDGKVHRDLGMMTKLVVK